MRVLLSRVKVEERWISSVLNQSVSRVFKNAGLMPAGD
jgi:hypothetical protein